MYHFAKFFFTLSPELRLYRYVRKTKEIGINNQERDNKLYV